MMNRRYSPAAARLEVGGSWPSLWAEHSFVTRDIKPAPAGEKIEKKKTQKFDADF